MDRNTVPMEQDWEISYRCKACGEMYDERNEAVKCFEGHTRRLGEMVEQVVEDGPKFTDKRT